MTINTPQTRSRAVLAASTLAAALLAACASSTTVPPGSSAASGPARPVGGHSLQAFIGSYDLNRDGVVTRDEYDTVRKQRFVAADTNGDGWLGEQEYVAEFEGRLKRQYESEGKAPDESYDRSMKQAHVRFGIVDRDKDGKFTIEEEMAIADRTFKNTDANGDGVVDIRDKKE